LLFLLYYVCLKVMSLDVIWRCHGMSKNTDG
jgi:hypothetical protein